MTGILAVETATDACSVAVFIEGQTLVRHVIAPRQHSKLLFGLLEELVPGGNLVARGIEVIAYGSGPGSFTGLRIAASVAQGIAYSSCLPAVAVPTLEVLAQGALQSGVVTADDTVLSLLDARVNEVYAAVYRFDSGLAVPVEGPWVGPPGDSAPAYPGDMCAVGSGCRYLEQFPEPLRTRLKTVQPELLPRAGDMIPLTQSRLARGDIQSPGDIQPMYVRDEIHWKKLGEQGKRT